MMRKILTIILALIGAYVSEAIAGTHNGGIPVIFVTDLYYPSQDVQDNIDLIVPFASKRIDLKAVIFDITQEYRTKGEAGKIKREPGFICVHQLNYIFGKNVPCGCSPFEKLTSKNDCKYEASDFETAGIRLIEDILRQSKEKITIVSTGSLRSIAIALNRFPNLMKSKVSSIYVSAGSTSPSFGGWNIKLDPLASSRVLESDIPLRIFPCATANGAFDKDNSNTFWSLKNMDFVFDMQKGLRNYMIYNILSLRRPDYLNYLESEALPEDHVKRMKNWRLDKWYGSGGCLYIWESAVWMDIANMDLVTHSDGTSEIIQRQQIQADDLVFQQGLRHARVKACENGNYSFEYINGKSKDKVFYRDSPDEYEKKMNQAVPNWYKSLLKN